MLGTDISAGILEFAQRRFDRAGLANAATRQMDGEHLDVQEGHYDAVISRPDERVAAWAEVGAALAAFEGPDGFTGPCRMLVGAGTSA